MKRSAGLSLLTGGFDMNFAVDSCHTSVRTPSLRSKLFEEGLLSIRRGIDSPLPPSTDPLDRDPAGG